MGASSVEHQSGRSIPESVDVVLLMGPLYHLQSLD